MKNEGISRATCARRGGVEMANVIPIKACGSGRRNNPPPPNSEETELISRLARGDESALQTIMERYGGAIRQYAYRKTGDMQLAEEITQDTLLKVWQHATQERIYGYLKAWLLRVARNNTVDRLRRKRPIMEEFHAELAGNYLAFNQPAAEAEDAWIAEEIDSALAELQPIHREVLELIFYHGLHYSEVSAALGVPLGTVKSRRHDAMRALRAIWRRRGLMKVMEG
jgi:RNA polymerase sigma-70 factor (ECF subfamily)